MITKPFPGARINWLHPCAKGQILSLLFNEGTGNQLWDYSLKGHTNIIHGPAWTPRTLGGSSVDGWVLDFNPVNDYVGSSFNFRNDIGNGNPFTLISWINLDEYGSRDHATVLGSTYSGSERTYFLIRNTGNPFIGLGDWYAESSGVGLTLDVWQHYAVTYDGSNVKVYMNAGIPWDSGNIGSKIFGNGAIRIGLQVNNANDFNGMISSVVIYNRALSNLEIINDYINPYEEYRWINPAKLYIPAGGGIPIPVIIYHLRQQGIV